MTKVSRVFDPNKINRAVNRPEVLKYVAPGYEAFDLTEFSTDRRNIVLRVESAFSAFDYVEDGVYEGHFLFPQEIRGPRALSAAKNMLREMFTTHRAEAIHGHTPREFRAARAFTRALGFKPVGASRNNADQDCVHYVLRREEWDHYSE